MDLMNGKENSIAKTVALCVPFLDSPVALRYSINEILCLKTEGKKNLNENDHGCCSYL